jgi:hypothetical protein
MGVLRMEVDDEDEDDELEEDKLDEDDQRLLLDERVSFDNFLLAFFRSPSDESLEDALIPSQTLFRLTPPRGLVT